MLGGDGDGGGLGVEVEVEGFRICGMGGVYYCH